MWFVRARLTRVSERHSPPNAQQPSLTTAFTHHHHGEWARTEVLQTPLTGNMQSLSDRLLGGLLLGVATFVFTYYTIWALITVRPLIPFACGRPLADKVRLAPTSAAVPVRLAHPVPLSPAGLGYPPARHRPGAGTGCGGQFCGLGDAKGGSEEARKRGEKGSVRLVAYTSSKGDRRGEGG